MSDDIELKMANPEAWERFAKEMAEANQRVREAFAKFADECAQAVARMQPGRSRAIAEASKGEWRCRCKPEHGFDKSINRREFVRCVKCGTNRP